MRGKWLILIHFPTEMKNETGGMIMLAKYKVCYRFDALCLPRSFYKNVNKYVKHFRTQFKQQQKKSSVIVKSTE